MTSYWNGSAWVDMVNPSATSSATVSFSVRDEIGLPRMMNARVQNSSGNPYGNSGSSAKGPFTGLLGDFMPIKVTDTDTNDILFYGLIKDVVESYAHDFGQVIDIIGEDYLMELRDNSTKNAYGYNISTSANLADAVRNTDLKNERTKEWSTTVSSRGGLIKSLITQFSDNIDHPGDYSSTDSRFVDSVKKFTESQEYNLGGSGAKSALAHILGLALTDPHTASGETEFGYDYYVDPNFTSTASTHKPKAYFNYFKRGTRPSTNPSTYGLTIDYPSPDTTSNGKFSQTGQRLAMTDFSFERPKDEIFTEANVDFKQMSTDVDGDSVVSGESAKMELWTVEDTTDVADFIWSGKYITGFPSGTTNAERLKLGLTTLTTALGSGVSDTTMAVASTGGFYIGQKLLIGTSSEIITVSTIGTNSLGVTRGSPRASHSNGATVYARNVATIQYTSSTTDVGSSGTIHVLVSDIDPGIENDNTNIWQTGSSSKLWVGETSGSSFKLKGRPKVTYGVKRTTSFSTGSDTKSNSVREQIVAKLLKNTYQIVRGDFKSYEAPRFYFDNSPTSIVGTDITLSGSVNPQSYGFMKGMTVVKLDSSGNPTSTHGYASGVSSTQVTVTMSDTISSGDTLRYFIPVRAGDLINIRNDLVDVDGKYLVTKLTYDIGGGGISFTHFEVVGAEEVKETGQARSKTLAQLNAAANTDEGLPPNLPFSMSISNSTTDLVFESVTNNTVKWHGAGSDTTPGKLMANGNSYEIIAGNTGAMNADGRDYYIYYVKGNEGLSIIEKSQYDTVASKNTLLVAMAWYATPEALFKIFVREFNSFGGKLDAQGRIAKFTVAAQLQKKGTQPWSTSTVFSGTGYNSFSWTSGNISFTDNDTESINASSRTMQNDTEYVYKLVGDSADPGLLVTPTYSTVFDDDKVMLATVVRSTDSGTDSPTIIPFNGNKLSISAGAIAANVITAANIKAGSITTTELNFTPVSGSNILATINASNEGLEISGDRIEITGSTSFASGYNPTEKAKIFTGTQTTSSGIAGSITGETDGDMYINTNTQLVYIRESGTWVIRNDAKDTATTAVNDAAAAQSTADGKNKIFSGTNSTSSAIAAEVTGEVDGDIYINTSTQDIYRRESSTWVLRNDAKTKANAAEALAELKAQVFRTTSSTPTIPYANDAGDVWINEYNDVIKISTGQGTGNWRTREDATAINNATTTIDGGLIRTQKIILKSGGGSSSILESSGPTSSSVNSDTGARVMIGNDGLIGYSSTYSEQFKIRATDGKAEFAGGDITMDSGGLTVGSGGTRLEIDDDGIQKYESYVKRLAIGNNNNGIRAWGPGQPDTGTPTQSNAVLFVVNTANSNYVAYISAGASASWMRYDAGAHNFRNFSNPGFINGIQQITYPSTSHTAIIQGNDVIQYQAGSPDGYSWDDHKFFTGGTQRFEIDSTQLTTFQHIRPFNDNVYDIGSSTKRFDDIYATNGNIQTSDRRLKEQIKSSNLGLDFINDLAPVSYRWKDTTKTPRTHYGLVAQDVLETLKKHGITERADFAGINGEEDTYYGARYTEFVAILIKAVQELSSKIEKLEEK